MNQDAENHGFLLSKTHPMTQMFGDILKHKSRNFACNVLKNIKTLNLF